MQNKRLKVTAPGDSDPQGPACGGDTVPVPPTSSSCEGRSGVLPTGTPVKTASAEAQSREVGGGGTQGKGRAGKDTSSAKSKGGPGVARSTARLRESVVDVLRQVAVDIRNTLEMGREDHPEARSVVVQRLVEGAATQLVSRMQEPLQAAHELRKEIAGLRAGYAELRAAAQVPVPPVAHEVDVGVQTVLPPTEEFVGVGGGMPPPTRRDMGSQTPADGGVGVGGGDWSLDRVVALIDAKVGALRDEIVAEVRRGVAAGDRTPVRGEETPSSGAPGPAHPSQDGVPWTRVPGRRGRKRKEGVRRGVAAVDRTPVRGEEFPSSGAPGPVRPSQDGVPWSRVLGRGERRREEGVERPAPPRPPLPAGDASGGGAKGRRRKAAERRPRLPRAPDTAAVVVAPVGESGEVDVDGAVDLAMGDITRGGCGITGVQIRRTFAGGLLLQIPGEDGSAKADSLAARIRGILADRGVGGVRVDRPVKLADLRVTGLVGPAAADKVARALADAGCCDVGEVRVGAIRRAPRGLGSAWVRLPVEAARRVAEAGKIEVGGWMPVGIVPIDSGPRRCYRCFCVGHAGRRCTAKEDRAGRCFRCGEPGHHAGACAAPAVKCPLCADLGRRSDHRLGAAACLRPPGDGGPGGGGGSRGGGGGGVRARAPAPRPADKGKADGRTRGSPPPSGPNREGEGGCGRPSSPLEAELEGASEIEGLPLSGGRSGYTLDEIAEALLAGEGGMEVDPVVPSESGEGALPPPHSEEDRPNEDGRLLTPGKGGVARRWAVIAESMAEQDRLDRLQLGVAPPSSVAGVDALGVLPLPRRTARRARTRGAAGRPRVGAGRARASATRSRASAGRPRGGAGRSPVQEPLPGPSGAGALYEDWEEGPGAIRRWLPPGEFGGWSGEESSFSLSP